MKRIILASNSPQRKKLMKIMGIKFSVRPSRARERKKIKTTCAAFVQENALRKAEEVAGRIKEGIVIGADTVVYLGKKRLILKPRNLKEAKKNLRVLFAKPQWVYTGLAVIDSRSGKRIVNYEKTKVSMTPLTNKEIDAYYRRVDPLGKAGGFDIEGLGSVFIHRVEGCYTNVIGLPMAKLFKTLKKFGVSVLSLCLLISVSGCVTEYNLATGKQETLMYTTEKEVKIGEKVAAQIEKQYEVVDDVQMNGRVERILDKIVEVSDRKDLVYFIKVLKDDELINAASIPGGYIYLFTGLMDKVENDDQLAGVIAHEVGHITAKHGLKRLQASYGALLVQILAVEAADAEVAGGVNLALTSLFMEYSQKAEFESDRLGVKYMKKAGYDPEEMINFLEIIKAENEKAPIRRFSYWKTHPHVTKRIAVVNQAITGRMDYRGYINLIGEYE